ncbi:MAG: hypothetical protein HFE68_05525 [Erysipelotrichaceae bacterium]|nr:hypothetical protein [Erysipelotrichaceae bacterium]
MWKRFSIGLMLVGMTVFAFVMEHHFKDTLDAALMASYYSVGTSFQMGGYTWNIIKDNGDGTGFIQTGKEIVSSCAHTSFLVRDDTGALDQCLATLNTSYPTGMSDRIGSITKAANGSALSSIQAISSNDYIQLTDNGTNFSYLPDYTWVDENIGTNKYGFYHSMKVSSGWQVLNGISGLWYDPGTGAGNYLVPTYLIQLPQSNFLDITANTQTHTMPYSDMNNQAGFNVFTITINDGEGPFHIEIYDTDASGNGTSSTPSTYFSYVYQASTQTIDLNLINQLPAGDYYFKVKVIDESTNEQLYLDPTNFTTDNKRTQESGVFHVSVTKVPLTIAFDDPSTTKKSIVTAGTNWSETATASPLNSDVAVTYTISGGDVGLIQLDPNTGAVTYLGGNAFGKVTIRATVDEIDPTANNYINAYVEKDIVIYREVDGTITPDPVSSDTTIPTFSASDPNIRTGGLIGKVQGTLGTPDTIGGTLTTFSYAIQPGGDASLFQVHSTTGQITSNANLSVGSYHFDIVVSDRWSSKTINVTVNVGMAAAENLKFYENSTSNAIITSQSVTLTDTNVSVFATVKGSTNTNPITYRIKDGSTNVVTVHPSSGAITIHGVGSVIIVAEKNGASGQANASAELHFTVTAGSQNFIYTDASGNELAKSANRYQNYIEVYAPSKNFQLYTAGNPVGSSVTYQLKAGSPSDVISVDPSGLITILNASLPAQIGRVIVEATSHDPSGNYADKTIELPIVIEKGTRTVSFRDDPLYVLNGSGSVVPSIEVDGVLDTSATAVIEIDPTEDHSIAWTNDGVTIQYHWSDAQSKQIKLQVTKPADRNYKAANGTGTLHILGANENSLTLSTPGKITYGDHFTIRSTQDDSMSTNVQYTFASDNGVFISAPQVTGNKAEFDALGNSGSTEITIKVTRTADGELPLTKTVKIKVLPKPITIEIEDKGKLRLEENPTLTYKDFKSQLVSWNGVQDVINESVIKLSTTAGKYSPVGTYPIVAKNAQKQLNDNYPNYTFTIKEGKLNIKDNGDKNFWDEDNDGCPDLNIELTDDNGDTILINGDKNEDGIPDYNIDINGDGKPDLNIDTDNDGKPDLNLVQLKSWKPSKCITIGDIQFSSGISAQAEINIDTNGDGIPDINIDTDGDFKADFNVDTDGDQKPNVNIGKVHTSWEPDLDFKTGNFTYDTMKQDPPLLNVDSDGDGLPDLNLDLDGDGTPDINIDHDGDGIPDTNIDGDGDGKADINIDTDGDGKPDENVKEITEWKPEHNANDPFSYDTMRFDEDDPSHDDDLSDKPNGEVQGSYYPGDNVGGALTGDTSNPLLYMGIGFSSLSILFFLMYKSKKDNI